MPTHYLYLPKAAFPVGGSATVHRVFADEDNTFSATCLDAGGAKVYLTFSAGYNGDGGGTFTVEVLVGADYRPAIYKGSNIWEFSEPTHVKSTDAPHFKWHDWTRKGDFVWCQASQDYCTDDVTAEACENACVEFLQRAPAVVAALFAGGPEVFTNAATKIVPVDDVEAQAGVFVRARIEEPDPFFQSPHNDCDSSLPIEHVTPMVESRCAEPAGAPSLPADRKFLGCPTTVGLMGRPATAAAISKVVAEGCSGCAKRRAALNAAVPKLGDAVAVVAKPVAWISDRLLGTKFLPPKDKD